MKIIPSLASLGMALALTHCASESRIERVREVPVKSAEVPGFQTGLHRAQVTYVMRGAIDDKEQKSRIGEYYYVTWTDARPDVAAELVMSCQRAGTGSQVHQKRLHLAPRKSGGSRKDLFSFIGEDYQEYGSLLTWKVDLKVDGKIVSTRHSYLWRDDVTTASAPSI